MTYIKLGCSYYIVVLVSGCVKTPMIDKDKRTVLYAYILYVYTPAIHKLTVGGQFLLTNTESDGETNSSPFNPNRIR